MPTYDFRCGECGRVCTVFRSIREHEAAPAPFMCHGQPMERFFTSPTCPMLDMLTNERLYEGLRAMDGTDISSRAKHRAYMKERGLTTVDDFTETWKRNAKERAQRLEGVDSSRTTDLVRAWETHRHG